MFENSGEITLFSSCKLWLIFSSSLVMFSYGLLCINTPVLADQQKFSFISSVWQLKEFYHKQWPIEMDGERYTLMTMIIDISYKKMNYKLGLNFWICLEYSGLIKIITRAGIPIIIFFNQMLYTLPVNSNGYVPFLINMLDAIVRVSIFLTK